MRITLSPLCATVRSFGMALAVVASAVLAPVPAQAQTQTQTPSAAPAASSAPAKPAAHAGRKPASAHQGAMDLHAPPLGHIYPRSELQYILADTSDPDSAEEVSVKGAKAVVPVPLGQLQAIPWAILHPTQAWRVFTPLEQP